MMRIIGMDKEYILIEFVKEGYGEIDGLFRS